MIEQKYEARELQAARVVAFAEEFGKWSNARYELLLSPNTPEIFVRDIATKLLVAYSSTKADYASSLEEFAWDYFTGEP